MFKRNPQSVPIEKDTALGRRGVSSISVRPLTLKQDNRVESILEADALKDYKSEFGEVIRKERAERRQAPEGESSKPKKKVNVRDQVLSRKAAWPYIIYSCIKAIDAAEVPSPPEGMLNCGESAGDGWLEDFSVEETEQLATIALQRSAKLEEPEDAAGNASDASTPTA